MFTYRTITLQLLTYTRSVVMLRRLFSKQSNNAINKHTTEHNWYLKLALLTNDIDNHYNMNSSIDSGFQQTHINSMLWIYCAIILGFLRVFLFSVKEIVIGIKWNQDNIEVHGNTLISIHFRFVHTHIQNNTTIILEPK